MNKIENDDGELPDTGVKSASETDGAKEDNSPPPSKPVARTRRDKQKLHATRHGIQSRRLYEALASRGENVRELRLIERSLRSELQPRGILGDILFDRAWACYLRCLLIAIAEKNLFAVENRPEDFEERLRRANQMALATGSANAEVNRSFDLLKDLSVFQRYDSHYWREFCRALDMLFAERYAGGNEVAHLPSKTFTKNKEIAGETND